MDGFGLSSSTAAGDNAIYAANTPNLDRILKENPVTKIGASGLDVGLPDGQMGNSEVGHTNIGAGRIVYQELTRITKSAEEGDMEKNPALVHAMQSAKENGKALHFMGLLSDGGVHSHNTHLYALLKMAKKTGLEKVFVHCFLDGRKVATVMGRYYAMDRDNRWERVEKAYAAMVYGEGQKAECPVCAVQHSYDENVTDEFVVPTVVEGAEPIESGLRKEGRFLPPHLRVHDPVRRHHAQRGRGL